MMNIMVVIMISAFGAGVIQAVTGFGSGVLMMMFFPAFFPLLNASALSASITLSATCKLTWRYRKHIHKEFILWPAVIYILANTLAILAAPGLQTELLLRFFGIFLIMLSVYFLIFSRKFHIRATLSSATVCAVLSGIANGLFGIGGPPMVIYFLAALDDKEEYLGTIQAFFMLTSIYTFVLRIFRGIFTADMLPLMIWGTLGIMVGEIVGRKIVCAINVEVMKKLVYVFLGITGILNLINL